MVLNIHKYLNFEDELHVIFLFKHISRIFLRAGSEARWDGDSWERIMCRGVSMLNSVLEAGARVILASSIPRDQMSTFLLHSNKIGDL